MMNVDLIKKYAEFWYSLGESFLPSIDSRGFTSFAASSSSIVTEVLGSKVAAETKWSIKVSPKTDTAYIDLEKNEIVVGAIFFGKSFYEERFGSDGLTGTEALAIAAINGLITHEALHLSLTRESVGGMLDTIKAYEPDGYEKFSPIVGDKIIATVWNIVEDIYIESRVPETLATWIDCTWEIFFPAGSADDLNDEIVTDGIDWGKAINMMILWKNGGLRDHDLFTNMDNTVRLLLKVAADRRRSTPISMRIKIAFDIISRLVTILGEPPVAEGEGDAGDQGSGDSSKSTGQAKLAAENADTVSDEEIDVINAEFESEVAKATEEATIEAKKEESQLSLIPAMIERDIIEMRKRGELGSPNGYREESIIDYSFLRELEASRTVNRVPGQARTSGSVIVKQRLSRIATDGKIFAKTDAERVRARHMEFIILVDMSGSTYTDNLINKELAAAKSISDALQKAGISHGVYGHTSYNGRVTPILIHLFSFRMKGSDSMNKNERFELARSVRLGENYDGFAIEAAAKKFTDRQGSRYMIVLSDGSPAGVNYWPEGEPHTKSEIAKLRGQKDTAVFSVSVTSSAAYANNGIYGKDWNIVATSDIQGQFRRLVRKLAI